MSEIIAGDQPQGHGLRRTEVLPPDEIEKTDKLLLALRGNDVGVWDFDRKAGRMWISDSIYAMQGYSAEEARTLKHFPEMFLTTYHEDPAYPEYPEFTHPGDRNAIDKLRAFEESDDEGPFEIEYRKLHKDGQWIWVMQRTRVVERDEQGIPTRLNGVRININKHKMAQLRLLAAEKDLYQAELRALRYRINPHFLFNVFNSLLSLVEEQRNELAASMIFKISGFYRAILQDDRASQITLKNEIDIQKQYLSIEQIRFPDEISAVFSIPDDCNEALIPPLLLQPLIENSVKYGLKPGSLLRIEVSASAVGNNLHLTVRDNGRSSKIPDGTGIGLTTTKQRLATLYGDAHAFHAGPLASGGFEVSLSMPLKR